MSSQAAVILGGGPAGCAAAIALRSGGIDRVLVVEAREYGADRIGESIPPDSRLLFERLGLLDAFEQEAHEACQGSCSSWGEDALGYNDFVFNPNGAGFHLDRRRFDLFMARQAIDKGVQLFSRTRFHAARPVKVGNTFTGFRLELESQAGVRHQVAASFVIDATGSGARFARNCGANRLLHDRFFCTTGYFHLREGAEFSQLTLLEAVPEGWWYAARLPDRRIAVAFACDASELKAESLHDSASWLKRLSQSIHLAPALADCFFIPDSLSVCGVPCFVLDQPAGNRWLAVGDSASSYDPLSSQGIYKALSNGLLGAETVQAALNGDVHAIDRYGERISNAFEGYVAQRNIFYQREQRWSHSKFWRRRQSLANASVNEPVV
jgi:flavin-dependent dehydrogenase